MAGSPWFADPSRVHAEGRMARVALEAAREQVSALLGVRARQIVLTSSGTEAINTAIWGAIGSRPGPIATARVEHSAVAAASIRHDTVELRVDSVGRLDLDRLESVLQSGVALVNCQWANHEVGTTQPVQQVVELAHQHGALVHVDACAAVGQVPTDLASTSADFVSVSAHKFGGPHGAGALVLGRGIRIPALMVGGAQERGRRAGMENVAAAVGFGAACAALGDGRLEAEEKAARARTERVLALAREIGGTTIYGDETDRLPHIVCFGVDGVEAEGVLIGLDQAGIAAHSGSACSSEELEPSPVLAAMGADADHSLRISVGWSTTDDDIDALARALPNVVDRLRSLR